MFDHARAAGLPMLGGSDVFIYHAGIRVRAHFWVAGRPSSEAYSHDIPAPDTPITDTPVETSFEGGFATSKTIVILPGFTEFCEKYSAEILRFHNQGYNVLTIYWPGQGQSGHLGKDPLAVHCDDFANHLGALDAVMDVVGLGGHDMVLFGHSMGGHLALRYAALCGDRVRGVILSAPMMAPPVMPVWLVRFASAVLKGMGLARSHPPFHRVLSLDFVRHFRLDNVLTRDPKGYEEQFIWFDDAPELRRSGPTIGWVNAAYSSTALYTLNPVWLETLAVPVLALVAGDERVVFGPATDMALLYIDDLERVDFPNARHELTRELPEVTGRLWLHVDAFLDRIDWGYI